MNMQTVSVPPQGASEMWRRLRHETSLTYANDIVHAAIGETNYFHPALDALALAAFWVMFLEAGLRLHEIGKQKGL